MEKSNAGFRCEKKRLDVNVNAYKDALWVADSLLSTCQLEAGLYKRDDSEFCSELLKSVFYNGYQEISKSMDKYEYIPVQL